ncbi:MAG TPA: vitamin B12 dependent-methionine synthase activation domain-containing protein [Ruminiclostridium sp.]
MGIIIKDKIDIKIDKDEILKQLHMEEDNEFIGEVLNFIEAAEKLAKPKGVYREVSIDENDNNSIVLNGTRFESPTLCLKLRKVKKVFVFVVTSGMELYEWSNTIKDMLENYWANMINQVIVISAQRALERIIKDEFKVGHLNKISPGFVEDWSIREQSKLLDLMEEATEAIGVKLTESSLMIPAKSLSGIFYED